MDYKELHTKLISLRETSKILDFQRGVNYLLGKTPKEEAPEMSSVDLKDFAQIVKPVELQRKSELGGFC
jgi:hypothetical protein